jgi:NAD(P)H:quinone oxidoreductase type IV
MIIQVVFYSMYGHIYHMAEAVAEGAREVPGADVRLFQVDELVPEDILEKTGAKNIRNSFAHVPHIQVEQLADADAIIFGSPTRYGMMCAQMRNFLDKAGGLWAKDELVNKIGSVFTSSATQHGGQETTITSFHVTLLHLGMIIVGVPYSEKRQSTMTEITGGSPYGASSVVGHGDSERPSGNELAIARFQGRHVAEIASQFAKGKPSI